MSVITLASNWSVLQDVHDSGDKLALEREDSAIGVLGSQLSEWEPIDEPRHLQLLFAETPYWGRSLRSFNHAPWWYKNEFSVDPTDRGALAILRFTNVDYYATVWLNGELLGEHEGYATPFEFDVSGTIRYGEPNRLVVKVSSPWDVEVRDEKWDLRVSKILREMVKGTYEHDDGLIQRDVNPVGIYGSVTVATYADYRLESPRVDYTIDDALTTASLTVSGVIQRAGDLPGELRVEVVAPDGATVAAVPAGVAADGRFEAALELAEVLLWETWDRGTPHLYTVRVSGPGDRSASTRVGFRRVSMVRDETQTTFHLNDRRLYVRGASYFPDVYMSQMGTARYRRDLEAARRAGLNLLRVHVHTEPLEFYELCDEYGIGVIQDTDFNWDHPSGEEWTARFVAVTAEVVRLIHGRPSIFGWICLNEPGMFVAETYLNVDPGPQLYAMIEELAPGTPIIKGSGIEWDPTSGDSHNYHGSLSGQSTLYTDIDGSTERLNTEFGFDAPASAANLATTGALYRRVQGLLPLVDDLQHYQYRLLKYYIEHYRTQRFAPCSGYVQFMLIDLCPQSFYGVLDWWGSEKRGMDAFLESGQPVAVILDQTATESSSIVLVNDTLRDLGDVRVTWRAVTEDGTEIAAGEETVAGTADSLVTVAPLVLTAGQGRIDVDLVATAADGTGVAANRYRGLFDHLPHPEGHPSRISEEYGVRTYGAS